MRKIGKLNLATLKVISKQYMSVDDLSESVNALYSEFEQEIIQILNDVVVQGQAVVDDAQERKASEQEKPTDISVSASDSPTPSIDDVELDISVDDSTPSWLKKLFKKIALKCHPDRVMSQNISDTEKHFLLSSYQKARVALDEQNEALLIAIGVSHDEVAEIGVQKSKSILTAAVSELQSNIAKKQKGPVWIWGMSEENIDVKANIVVHAAAQFYNKSITPAAARKAIEKYFDIVGEKVVRRPPRKVGTHPGKRIKHERKSHADKV